MTYVLPIYIYATYIYTQVTWIYICVWNINIHGKIPMYNVSYVWYIIYIICMTYVVETCVYVCVMYSCIWITRGDGERLWFYHLRSYRFRPSSEYCSYRSKRVERRKGQNCGSEWKGDGSVSQAKALGKEWAGGISMHAICLSFYGGCFLRAMRVAEILG